MARKKSKRGTGHPATIKDVAALSGMSTLTVSRVLNGNPSIKASTRERVEKAIAELNYTPSAAAQSMRRGSTRTIGFLMPDFAHGISSIVAQNVERVMHREGFTVMLACSHFDPRAEVSGLRTFQRNRVDAVLLKTCDETSEEIASAVEALACPVLLVDRDLPVETDAVVVDHAAAMEQVVRDLHAKGHRDIALISPGGAMRPGRERMAGYLKAMQDLSLPVPEGRLVEGGTEAEESREIVLRILGSAEPPTAIIAGGNVILYGALAALQEAGVRYPEEISLVGADHPLLGSVMNPRVTMIDRQPVPLAETVADMLLERLRTNPDGGAMRKVLPARIIEGGSCRAL